MAIAEEMMILAIEVSLAIATGSIDWGNDDIFVGWGE